MDIQEYTFTKEEQNKYANRKINIYNIREEMSIREEIQIYRRYLRKTVHNPYTEEQQEQFQERIKKLFELLYKIEGVEKPRWDYYDLNRRELRHLNIVYRIIRGKEPIYPTKSEYSQSKIDELVKRFSKDWIEAPKDEYKKMLIQRINRQTEYNSI